MISASAGIADTIGPAINGRDFAPVQTVNPAAESYKTYMGSVAVTAPQSLGFLSGSTLYGGVVNGYDNSVVGTGLPIPTLNAYVGGTLATPVTGLRLGAAWDLLNIDSNFNTPTTSTKTRADIWSLAGYASFQATEKLSFHGRFEYVNGDIDEGLGGVSAGNFGRNNGIFASTLTAQYDLWKNVISRIEFRWDHAEHGDPFGGTTPGVYNPVFNSTGANRADAYLLAANIIYKF